TIGRGDQDNYIKLVTNAHGGDGGIQFAGEIQGAFDGEQVSADILGSDFVDLYLTVDPAVSSVVASYVIVRDDVRGPRTAVGQPIAMPASWLSDVANGPAIGIISTSSGADPFPASWSFVEVFEGTGEDFPVPGEGELAADPPVLAFPETLVGNTAVLTLTMSNIGDAALEINDAVISGDQAFTTNPALPQILEPGAAQDFYVSFTPDVAAGFEAVLTLSHDGGNSPLQVSMTGQGVQTTLALEPTPGQLDFGDVVAGAASEPQTVSLVNTGEAAAVIGNLGLSGAAAADFSLEAATDNCSGVELAVGQACTFAVGFQPTQTGGRSALVDIPSNAGDLAVALQGQGLVAVDLQITAAPNPAIAGSPLTYSLVVSNLAGAPADNVALAITLPADTTLLSTQGCEQDPVGHPACNLGQIPANGNSEVLVSVEVSSSASGSLIFGASATADSLQAAVVAEITTPVILVADLSLVMTGETVPVDDQTTTLIYVIMVRNAGPSDALSALVMTEFAPGLENIEWTCDADATATCTNSGQGEIEDLVDLPAGTGVTYSAEVTVSRSFAEEGVTSWAEVVPSDDMTDPNLANNDDSITIGDLIFRDGFESID
ncbi:MAG: choice-of-anchor D domain-containing protein, partial [Wenzhouxiangella sp.]